MERTFSGHTHLLIPLRLLSTWVYGTNLIILYALVYDLLLAGLPPTRDPLGPFPSLTPNPHLISGPDSLAPHWPLSLIGPLQSIAAERNL